MVKHWHCLHLMQRDLKFKAGSLVTIWSKRSSVGLGMVLSWPVHSSASLSTLCPSLTPPLPPSNLNTVHLKCPAGANNRLESLSLGRVKDMEICLSPVGNFLVAGKGGSQWDGEERSVVGMATQPGCLHGFNWVVKCKCYFPRVAYHKPLLPLSSLNFTFPSAKSLSGSPLITVMSQF